MTTVVYITGAGRSGSTVLNAALGAAEDVVAVGELTNLPVAGWLNEEYCACGTRVPDCEFWNRVRATYAGSSELGEERLPRLQLSVERLRRVYRLAFSGNSMEYRQYGHELSALFEAIRTVSGKAVIIDASKNPLRAIALARHSEIDLRVVHLVRDARGVAWSLSKPYKRDDAGGIQRDMKGRSMIRSVIFWIVANVLSEIAIRQVAADKRVRVRYEDFVTDPSSALDRIEKVTGASLQSTRSVLIDGGSLPFDHTVAGNRVRMGGAVTLRPDREWQTAMPPGRRRLLRLLAWPLMRRYGYE